jgi:hypothetical protein
VAFPLSDTSVNKSTITQPSIPAGLKPPAAIRDPSLGASGLQFYYPASHDPYMVEWSLDIQRELPFNMMLDVGYVGTHGTHLAGDNFKNFNYVHTKDLIKYKTGINAIVPITNYYSGATAQQLEKVYGSSSLPLIALLKPYPFFGAFAGESIGPQALFNGASLYNGLNVKLQKRYSYGLNFIAAYTFSKKIYNAAVSQIESLVLDPVHTQRPGLVGGRIGSIGQTAGGVWQNPDD